MITATVTRTFLVDDRNGSSDDVSTPDRPVAFGA
jgi:hypothetical protein